MQRIHGTLTTYRVIGQIKRGRLFMAGHISRKAANNAEQAKTDTEADAGSATATRRNDTGNGTCQAQID